MMYAMYKVLPPGQSNYKPGLQDFYFDNNGIFHEYGLNDINFPSADKPDINVNGFIILAFYFCRIKYNQDSIFRSQ